ncbi:hypothetical protein [Sedimenticola sp.]
MATATADGQPYVQHRGGAPAFCKCWTPRPWVLQISGAAGNT